MDHTMITIDHKITKRLQENYIQTHITFIDHIYYDIYIRQQCSYIMFELSIKYKFSRIEKVINKY